ncbi:MAG: type II toxin-antitoxin system VapC family toxin [Steroidobacteraceae bacterium]
MRAVDTSVVVAAFASWHEYHDPARLALDDGARLIDHCALETYSVLTRLPAPHRSTGEVVGDFLRLRFTEPYLRLDGRAYREFVFELPERRITGGAAYDALVGATAVAHSADLITCDRRAAPTYESLGVHVVLLR